MKENKIDLSDIISFLWSRKIMITAITLIFAVCSVVVSLQLPNIYRSTAVLSPMESGDNTSNNLAGRFGGLASLSNILINEQVVDKTTLGIAVVNSKSFFKKINKKHDLLVPLMASTGWDPILNELKIDPKIYDVENKEWVRKVSFPKSVEPSIQEAHAVFMKQFSIQINDKNNLIIMSVDHYSPYIAKDWLDKIILEINLEIKKQDIDRAESSINFLKQQISSTNLTEVQDRLYDLIQKQTEIIMLANASPEYIFNTIDEGLISEEKIGPNRAIICILTTIFGFIIAVFISLMRSYFIQREIN